jgi:CMP-N-acetylneuraminic acid synthetase
MKIYALIPARAGSKGVVNKNTRCLGDKPLIAYSIEAALEVSEIDRVIVTTDSESIAAIGSDYGAEVPFLRPAALAQDMSSDRGYIEHALNWFRDNEKREPDLIVVLRPTTPIRDSRIVAEAIQKMKSYFYTATSLKSVHPLSEPPQKMLKMENECLTGFFPHDNREEYYNLPRQCFPQAYQPNGYVDIVKTSYIRGEQDKIFGPCMVGFITPHSVEVDTEEELEYLEYLIGKNNERLSV